MEHRQALYGTVRMAALGVLISALIVAVATALPAHKDSESISQDTVSRTARNYRLPDNVVPIHYNIKLIPYIEEGNFTFDGESSTSIRIRRSTHSLRLHMNLTIDEAATNLVTTNGNSYVPTAHNYDNVTEILDIEFENDLSPEVYTLNMKFVGILSDDLRGFYRTSYLTEDSNETWLAATQFQPTWARRAFPCWDEPALKATFNISIKHNRNHTVLSNMPLREQTDDGNDDGMIWSHFEKTPIMSTYLVAFVVSDFVRVPTEDSTVNIWSRPALTPYFNYLGKVVTQSGRILTEYTNITNKVPKMDHVVLPQLVPDGMENWGLVIYREDNVIFNEENNTLYKIQTAVGVGAHEMAHQWFGNLVGPLWWSDLWLNEGFATLSEQYILDKLFSNWQYSYYFVVVILQQSLHFDIGNNIMPLTLDVNTPNEIQSLFGPSVYEKAPSILRMLHHIVTGDVFQKGVIKYIDRHQFGSVTADDLWSALQEALDESDVPHDNYNVKEVMDTWIKQWHYPVVNVTRNYDNGDIILTQEHFHPRHKTGSLDDGKWWIPITFATQSNPDFSKTSPSHWLRPHDQNITIKGVDPNDWIIVNLQETGYYRVQYDYNNWWKIIRYLNSDNYANIHTLNRAQIIDDFAHLSTTSFDQKLAKELASYLVREKDYVVHIPVIKLLHRQQSFFKLPGSNSLKSRALRVLSAFVKRVGYEESPTDDNFTKITRASVLELACTFGHNECRKMAAIKLSKHLADPETHKISPNLRDWIFCNGMIEADASTLYKFMKKYAGISNESFLKYLACSEKSDILNNILNTYLLRNESVTATRKYKTLFTNIVEKHADNDLILDYLLTNIKNIIISSDYIIEKIFTDIINNIHSIERLDKIINFVKPNFDNEIFEQTKITIEERKTELSDLIAKYHLQDKTGKF